MATKIAIPNHKGGVGKTTTATNLAHALAMKGYRVVVVDLDPQGQSSTALGLPQEPSVFKILVNPDEDALQWVRRTGRENLEIISGDRTTSTAQLVLNAENRPMSAIKTALQELEPAYDFIIFDTAPSVGGIQERAVFASDLVIVPTATEFLSIDGMGQMLATLKTLQHKHQWQGRLVGVLPTFYDEQTTESKQSLAQLQETFNGTLLPSIHRATILRECAADGKTIFEMNPQHRAAREYESLAALVERKA